MQVETDIDRAKFLDKCLAIAENFINSSSA